MATRRRTTKVDGPISDAANGHLRSANMQSDSPAPYSPFLPTALEFLLLSIYPTILLLGSLYSTFHPALRAVEYLPTAQSYDPRVAPSYFAKKSNVFNLYFVKVGWLWMTAAFLLLIFTHASHGPPLRPSITRRRAQAVLRYAAITAAWFAMTQWFFGPAIIDRSFRWTGGQCDAVLSDAPEDQLRKAEMGDVREVLTHAACKAIGGTWRGGHDISGHVFLLILGSAMLVLEVLPAILRSNGIAEARRVRTADGSVQDATTERGGSPSNEQTFVAGIGIKVALAVAGLSLWMLLMTAAYFHTWFEKMTGSLVAFVAIYLVYFLPRALPGVRNLLGLPGI